MKKYFESFFDENTKFIFIATVIVMLLAHGFCFMNLMYSHDSLSFADTDGLVKIGLGRWLYPFLVHQRSIAAPWLMGVFSILYISLAVVLVAKLFNFSKLQGMCVGILFATNVTLTSLFCTYIYDADADCLSLLLACFAVYAFKKCPPFFNYIIPIISISLCLATYQPYICVSAGLFLTLLMYESIESNNWKDIFNACFTAIKELIILLLGIVLYIPLMHAATKYYNVGLLTGYNGAGNLNSLKLVDVINDIPIAYQYLGDTFFKITEYNTLSIVRINWLMICLLLVSMVLYVYNHRKFLGSLVIIVPCLLIMPLGVNAIHLVSFGVMHQLMIFAFCIVYLLPLIFCSKVLRENSPNTDTNKRIMNLANIIVVVSFLAIIYIGFSNIVYSNGAYVYKKLVYDNTALHLQTIWKDINNVEGYKEGKTKIVFMGNVPFSKAAYSSSVGTRYDNVLTGASNSSITFPYTIGSFFHYILGRELVVTYDNARLLKNSEYIKMPAYPTNGYCKKIGKRVVVKLQE